MGTPIKGREVDISHMGTLINGWVVNISQIKGKAVNTSQMRTPIQRSKEKKAQMETPIQRRENTSDEIVSICKISTYLYKPYWCRGNSVMRNC